MYLMAMHCMQTLNSQDNEYRIIADTEILTNLLCCLSELICVQAIKQCRRYIKSYNSDIKYGDIKVSIVSKDNEVKYIYNYKEYKKEISVSFVPGYVKITYLHTHIEMTVTPCSKDESEFLLKKHVFF